MKTEPFASFWLAAGESGFASPSAWANWADEQINSQPIPTTWMMNLSMAKGKDDLWRVLPPVIELEIQGGFSRDLIHQAVLGYLWLRFERGEMDLRSCLEQAGRYADAYDTGTECEAIFSLLNILENGNASESARVQRVAERLFGPMTKVAREQWAAIQDL